MEHSSSSLLSRTASSSAQPRSRSPLASTCSAGTATSSSESVAQLMIFEARRLLAHCEDSLDLRGVLDDICKKQRDLRSRVPSDPNLRPLQPNPAPDAHAHVIPALQDVVEVLPHTVEELTAAQLRRVFVFITTSGRAQPEPQAADTTLLTPEQQRHIARIVFHMRKLAAVLDCANNIFLNTQTLLLRPDKASISYARYMAYIHVIQHVITGITVHRDIISEVLLSHFFTRSQSFLDALVGCQISESVIMEKLMAASAAVARAIRLTRTLEYYQMEFVMTHLRQKIPFVPTTYIQALRWWQKNYEEQLHGPLTEDYLEIAHSEDPFAQQQKERFVRVEFHDDQPQVATTPAAPNISAFSPGTQPMQTEQAIRSTQAPQSPAPSPFESRSSPVIIPLTRMSTPITELERNQSIPPVLSPQVNPVAREGGLESSQQLEAAEPSSASTGRCGLLPPCVFCEGYGHFSADGSVVTSMSKRIEVALEKGFCSVCLKKHHGKCKKRYYCWNCGGERHHCAFCMKNTQIVRDMDWFPTHEKFYAWLDANTHPPIPSGSFALPRAETSQPHRRARE
ncbi:unnamed protein product [Cylicocyclus nassatus]|uniref:Uncharacterized protein n=1 Tax=Cylicocyclus nassatus TaxID=53992 RepID=A0AA36GHF2_CYLNA|nr:unnamed protein product [Cylicocyclus nassatus]